MDEGDLEDMIIDERDSANGGNQTQKADRPANKGKKTRKV